MSWVSFKKICRPKKKGGLGVRSLRLVNKSLLARWHIRYCREKTALWRVIVCEKSNAEEHCMVPMQVKDPVKKSMWFDILRENKVFYESVNLQVKNGATIRFWHDWWCEKRALKDKYPRLYKLSLHKMATVEAMVQAGWASEFSRELNPAERIDLLEIKYDIRAVTVAQGEEDCLEKEVTAKEIYLKLLEAEPDWEYYGILRNKEAPPKVTFLLWAALLDSIPTRFMLQSRRVVIQSNLCLLCNTEVETQNHLFIHCSTTKKLWDYFIASLRASWVMPAQFTTLMQSWRLNNSAAKIKKVWSLILFAICWEIWNERNRRHHGGRAKTDFELKMAVKQWIVLWHSNTDTFKGFTMTQIINQWEDILYM